MLRTGIHGRSHFGQLHGAADHRQSAAAVDQRTYSNRLVDVRVELELSGDGRRGCGCAPGETQKSGGRREQSAAPEQLASAQSSQILMDHVFHGIEHRSTSKMKLLK